MVRENERMRLVMSSIIWVVPQETDSCPLDLGQEFFISQKVPPYQVRRDENSSEEMR
jgi:hypothetical protein